VSWNSCISGGMGTAGPGWRITRFPFAPAGADAGPPPGGWRIQRRFFQQIIQLGTGQPPMPVRPWHARCPSRWSPIVAPAVAGEVTKRYGRQLRGTPRSRAVEPGDGGRRTGPRRDRGAAPRAGPGKTTSCTARSRDATMIVAPADASSCTRPSQPREARRWAKE